MTDRQSRFYETVHDLWQMQGLLMEARSRTDDWRYWHVGELLWNFFMAACHLNHNLSLYPGLRKFNPKKLDP